MSPSCRQEFHLLSLSDDILFGILFSGYLGYSWSSPLLVEIALASKRLLRLAKKNIGFLKSLDSQGDFYLRYLSKNLERIVFLDLSHSYLELNYLGGVSATSFARAIVNWRSTLRTLSLRGTNISDNCLEYLATLSLNLESLDLSKSKRSQKQDISDTGVQSILASSKVHNLLWLNLSMTSITDNSVALFSKLCPQLEVLGLQCCINITDNSMTTLSQSSLKILNINGCLELSARAIMKLMENSYPNESKLRLSIEMLACAHLPEFKVDDLELLMSCPRLLYLDCRVLRREEGEDTSATHASITTNHISQARKKFVHGIVFHPCDQLEIPFAITSSIEQLQLPFPPKKDQHFKWPYVS